MKSSRKSAAFILKELKKIENEPNESFSVGIENENIYKWNIIIFGPSNTPYEDGIFRAQMTFTTQYPDSPPTFKFTSKMWHPNIDKNGNVCISILHKPGDDEYGYEKLNERWMPVRNAESVIISIISLLDAPNCESPANIEAAHELRETPNIYYERVKRFTDLTKE